MLKTFLNKNTLSYLGILLSIVAISYLYLFPVLEGKVLHTTDLVHHNGMAQELREYRNATGEEGLWTNSMFCGMPGYLISIKYPGNIINPAINKLLPFNFPVKILIVYLLGFFILLTSLKVNKWLSLIGAFAFAFSSYFIIIIESGHTSKAYAIGFLPIIAAGLLLAYKKKYLPGFFLFALGLTLEIGAEHYQITYYGAILFFFYVLVEFIFAIKEKALQDFGKSTLVIVAGLLVAVGVNFASLYSIYEYSQQTIRGPSELTLERENRTSGLNKEYIMRWSQGMDETFTLLIPNFKGGSTNTHPAKSSELYKLLRQKRVSDINKAISQIYHYHGDKPGTSGPVYAGAIMVFLFVLSLFLLKGRYKWWLLSATIVSIVLSWGRHIQGVTSFLLDYLPLYNKFRAPEMILVVAEFTIPLAGIIVLQKIIKKDIEKKELFRGLKWTAIISGGFTLVYTIMPGIFDNFQSNTDVLKNGNILYPDWLYDAILNERKSLLRADAFRSFVLIALTAALIYFAFFKEKLKSGIAMAILGALIFADLWTVDKRYLNNDNFVKPRETNATYEPNMVSLEILKDKDPNYRVLPLANRFNDSYYSFWHKNILGYHAAKLSRPHEIMNAYLVKELEGIYENFKEQVEPTYMPPDFKLANMLNARYIIYSDERLPMKNPHAMGNAWFVDTVKIVADADEEFQAIKDFNPRTTALVDKRFENQLEKTIFNTGKNDTVEFLEYKPNYLKYRSKTKENQLIVFSEVYYDKGWNAYLNGEKVPYLRANYMLRGMMVPAGEHNIEFKFEPKSYFVGNKISYASSFILILSFLGLLFIEVRKWPLKNE